MWGPWTSLWTASAVLTLNPTSETGCCVQALAEAVRSAIEGGRACAAPIRNPTSKTGFRAQALEERDPNPVPSVYVQCVRRVSACRRWWRRYAARPRAAARARPRWSRRALRCSAWATWPRTASAARRWRRWACARCWRAWLLRRPTRCGHSCGSSVRWCNRCVVFWPATLGMLLAGAGSAWWCALGRSAAKLGAHWGLCMRDIGSGVDLS